MLRIHFLKHWFELPDPVVEEALYVSWTVNQLVGIDLGQEPVPDETIICKSWYLMERHNLSDELFRPVNGFYPGEKQLSSPTFSWCVVQEPGPIPRLAPRSSMSSI